MAKVVIDRNSIASKVTAKVGEINKGLKSKKLLDDVGKAVTKDIQFNTRKGQGFDSSQIGDNPSGKRASLPALQSSTIKYRRYIAAYNKTAPVYKADRSNLSITGSLIKSLTFKISRGVITFFNKGNHKRYKGKKGQLIGKSVTNDKLQEFLEDLEFYYLGISNQQIDNTKKLAVRFIRRLLRRVRR